MQAYPRFRRSGALAVLSAVLLLGHGNNAVGQEHGRWHGEIHRFHDHDLPSWRMGRWWNGWHDGRDGWWWIANGVWYWYPRPVYPYPDPYSPPMVAPAPVGQMWYYCQNPPGYYPYVANCMMPWQMVQPSAGPPAAPAPMAAPTIPAPTIPPAAGNMIPGGAGGSQCREFQQTVMVDGRSEQIYGTACRQPDGTWKVIGQ